MDEVEEGVDEVEEGVYGEDASVDGEVFGGGVVNPLFPAPVLFVWVVVPAPVLLVCLFAFLGGGFGGVGRLVGVPRRVLMCVSEFMLSMGGRTTRLPLLPALGSMIRFRSFLYAL